MPSVQKEKILDQVYGQIDAFILFMSVYSGNEERDVKVMFQS